MRADGRALRPLLMLDVDGVLNPYAAPACPAGYQELDLFPGEEPVWLCSQHGPWLRELAVEFELVWATGWGADANLVLAPLLRLPDLPVLALPPAPFDPADKLPAVASFARDRPLAWIDDLLPADADGWASGRGVPTLLLGVDPAEGLTRPAVDQALGWAVDLRS